MNELIKKISICIEFGKIDKSTPIPPELHGHDGADELTKMALETGVKPSDVLNSLVSAMEKVGQKFAENQIFVPQMLMSAKAMGMAMKHLRPYFLSGSITRKGTFIIGTVAGDLHDIGKNIVAMMVEGGGWEVINLGVDVKTKKFLETIQQHPKAVIGLSALLTTTMENMEKTVRELKKACPFTKIMIGGAPVNHDFKERIGADFYSPDPHSAVQYLNQSVN